MKKTWLVVFMACMLCACSTSSENDDTVRMGSSYYASHGDGDVALVSVAMKDDVIVGVTLDEISYLSSDEFKGLPNTESDKAFGKQTDPTKNLASKSQNDEEYSGMMKANGATQGIKQNYQALIEFVKGKSLEDLRGIVTGKSDEEVTDAVTGCTLKSTKGYLEAIMEACKNVKQSTLGVTIF